MSASSEQHRNADASGVTALRDHHDFCPDALDAVPVPERDGRIIAADG